MIKFLEQQWSIITIVTVAIILSTIVVIVIVHKRRKKNTENSHTAEIKRVKVKCYLVSNGPLW